LFKRLLFRVLSPQRRWALCCAGLEEEFVMQVPAPHPTVRARVTAVFSALFLFFGWTAASLPSAVALPGGVTGLNRNPLPVPDITLVSHINPSVVGQYAGLQTWARWNSQPVPSGYITVSSDIDGVMMSNVPASNDFTPVDTNTLSPGVHTITAQYSDPNGFYASSSAQLEQVVFGAVAGGPYLVPEGGSLTLEAVRPIPGATYEWDLNSDDDFSDATGPTPTLTWAELVALGIQDMPATYPVVLKVTLGHLVAEDDAVLEIVNQAPVAVVTGETTGTVGVPLTLKVSAEDSSPADMEALFEYTVDWGDGTPLVTVTGPADPPVTHTYQAAGTYTVVFTATDRDGATSEPVSVTVTIVGAPRPPAPTETTTPPVPTDTTPTDTTPVPTETTPIAKRTLPATGVSGGGERALLAVSLIGLGAALVYYSRRRITS